MKRLNPDLGGEQDDEAEYDSPKTLQAIREAIASYGHEVVDLEATSDLPILLASTPVDVVFNIAEGFKGRSRESQVPALLELLDIPYTGSDPATLSVSLDKALAKRMVTHARRAHARLPRHEHREGAAPEGAAPFPLLVKPVAEGTSKGVTKKSIVRDEAELREVAREMIGKYRQPALVEEYVAGREFTVGLLGERRPRVLPPMEIVFLDASDPTPDLLLRDEAGLERPDPLRGPREADAAGAGPARAGGARGLRRARLPRRGPRRLPHGRARGGSTSSRPTRCPG